MEHRFIAVSRNNNILTPVWILNKNRGYDVFDIPEFSEFKVSEDIAKKFGNPIGDNCFFEIIASEEGIKEIIAEHKDNFFNIFGFSQKTSVSYIL